MSRALPRGSYRLRMKLGRIGSGRKVRKIGADRCDIRSAQAAGNGRHQLAAVVPASTSLPSVESAGQVLGGLPRQIGRGVRHPAAVRSVAANARLNTLGLVALDSQLMAAGELPGITGIGLSRLRSCKPRIVHRQLRTLRIAQAPRKILHDRIIAAAVCIIAQLLFQVFRGLTREPRDGRRRRTLAVRAVTRFAGRCVDGSRSRGDRARICRKCAARPREHEYAEQSDRAVCRESSHADTRGPGFLRYLFLSASIVQ
jgi:hypothetical protein